MTNGMSFVAWAPATTKGSPFSHQPNNVAPFNTSVMKPKNNRYNKEIENFLLLLTIYDSHFQVTWSLACYLKTLGLFSCLVSYSKQKTNQK